MRITDSCASCVNDYVRILQQLRLHASAPKSVTFPLNSYQMLKELNQGYFCDAIDQRLHLISAVTYFSVISDANTDLVFNVSKTIYTFFIRYGCDMDVFLAVWLAPLTAVDIMMTLRFNL